MLSFVLSDIAEGGEGNHAATSSTPQPLSTKPLDGSSNDTATPMTTPDTSTATTDEPLNPFLYLSFELFDETRYEVGPYQFPSTFGTAVFSDTETKVKYCLGDRQREYVCFGTGYAFPDRRQLPTSAGTEAVRLYVDPRSPQQAVYIQLAPEFPPAMWLR